MFPNELKGLTPVEEKLISLNSCYGFVTRYCIPGGQKQAVKYLRHVKGHITVFPNNLQELATKTLPHPLVQVMDEIHASWQGAEKPAPRDLSGLLLVRRRVVEKAMNKARCESGAKPDQNPRLISEDTSSGMFALDRPLDIADAERLQFI